MSEPLLIRKYKNRRLYDTKDSRFVTRDEILKMIREGTDVQVEDVSSGEDATAEVLLQVIVEEQAGRKARMIPSDFLHFLIRANQNALSGFFQEFLPRAMRTQQDLTRRMFGFWQMPFEKPEKNRDAEIESLKSELESLQSRLKKLSDP